MAEDAQDEPYPGYRYDNAARRRAASAQTAAREATQELAPHGLFDTEPAGIVRVMNAAAPDSA